MISSASSSDRTGRPEIVAAGGESTARAKIPGRDSVSTERAAFLKSELARQPEVRPDVVARALRLAGDPNYPGPDIVRDVAQKIISSPDLSEKDN